MNNNLKTIIVILIVIGIGAFIYTKNKQAPVEVTPVVVADSVKGCYVATLAKDVYTLNIADQMGENFTGTLRFKNFEKDSSSGTFVGTYKDGILLGDYSFQSEGTNSVMQVIFKKTAYGFVRGYGDVDSNGTHFTDLSKITYDAKQTFKPSSDCGAPVVSSKLPAGSAPTPSPASIQSKTWIWQKTIMSDGAVITPKKAGAFTITLGADGKASGKTDCNGYFSSYNIGSDGVISFGNIGSTLMFCEGSQEAVFTGQIAKASHYILDSSGNLVLLLPYDSGSILFTK